MRKYFNTVTISSFDDMVLSIFVIGYKNIGESLVILIKDTTDEKDPVKLSIVIDSFEKGDLNLSKKILEKNKVKNVDYICWTHPHTDHTPGIDKLIEQFFSPDLYVFMPKFYFGSWSEDLLKKESKFTTDIYDSILSFMKKHSAEDHIRTISAEGDWTNHYAIALQSELESKDLDIYFLTPIGTRMDTYAREGNQFSNSNELSISFLMSVNGYCFYFGGDTEGKHAEGILDEIVNDFRWIKVPHHCSKGGRSIVDRLGPKLDYAASTVFTQNKLPDQEIQDAYIDAGSRLFMTQLSTEDLPQEYGVIQFDYHFQNTGITVDEFTYGNAGEYFKLHND